MVSCLTLIDRTHRLQGRSGGMSHTACGLAVEDALASSGLFSGAALPTCERCRAAEGREPQQRAKRPLSPKIIVETLLDAIADGDLDLIDAVLAGSDSGSQRLLAGPVTRLLALFPNWRVGTRDLIAEGSKVVAVYSVTSNDPSGLLSPMLADGRRETVIFTVMAGQVTSIAPITDTFGFWAALKAIRPALSSDEE